MIECGSGTGLSYNSCFDAFRTFGHRDGYGPVRVGQRGTGTYAYNLPWRRISVDGRCTFDIIKQGSSNFEDTTGAEITRAARDLLNQCVRDQGQKDGIITGIGKSGSLSIVLRKYNPSGITCQEQTPQHFGADKCDILLANMPADVIPKKWGPPGS
ncbi:MAG: hypothetical protein Q9224_006209, partial [Gallowayella concinna]